MFPLFPFSFTAAEPWISSVELLASMPLTRSPLQAVLQTSNPQRSSELKLHSVLTSIVTGDSDKLRPGFLIL